MGNGWSKPKHTQGDVGRKFRKKEKHSSSYSMYLDGARRREEEEPKPMKLREDSPSLVVAASCCLSFLCSLGISLVVAFASLRIAFF